MDAFKMTRREIEHHARYVGAADSDDLPRWLVAWCWFNWRPKDPVGAVISAARRMGLRRELPEDEAIEILEESVEAPKHMKADALAVWLGCTWADRCACHLTRIGACDAPSPQERKVLAKQRRRLAKRAERRRKGVMAREQWLAKTVTAEARRKGVDRSTIYRRRQRAKARMQQGFPGHATGVSQADSFPSARDTPVAFALKEGAAEGEISLRPRPRIIIESVGMTAGGPGA
jgi:hypothetical protein